MRKTILLILILSILSIPVFGNNRSLVKGKQGSIKYEKQTTIRIGSITKNSIAEDRPVLKTPKKHITQREASQRGLLGWITLSPMPNSLVGHSVAGPVLTGDEIIVVTGGSQDFSTPLNNTYLYDFTTDSWSVGSNMPTALFWHSSAVCKNKVYVFGGYDGSSSYNTIYEYDPSADTTGGNPWTLKSATLPQTVYFTTAETYNDSVIYIIGGQSGSSFLNTVYMYDVVNDTIKTATALPISTRSHGSAIIGDTLYVWGGWNGNWVYDFQKGVISTGDLTTISWGSGPNLPISDSRTNGASVTDPASGTHYVITSTGNSGDTPSPHHNYTYTYNPGDTSWVRIADKPTIADNSDNLIGIDSVAFMTGGYDGTAATNTTEALFFASNIINAKTLKINTPTSFVDTFATISPSATVQNTGDSSATFDVVCIIDSEGVLKYLSYKTVSSLSPNDTASVQFDDWTTGTQGEQFNITVYTNLTGDMIHSDDTLKTSFTCGLPGGDFLVWDPTADQSSGPVIYNQLQNLGFNGDYCTDLTPYLSYLHNYSSIWVSVGIYSSNYTILDTSQEAIALESYLSGGGNMYLEGGDVWYYDPQYSGGHDFGPTFGINATDDGGSDLATVMGTSGTITDSMHFTYSGENNWIDHIDPTGAGTVIFTNSNPTYNCGVSNVLTAKGRIAEGRTVGTSFEFAGLDDGEYTKSDLAKAIMSFFRLNAPVFNYDAKVSAIISPPSSVIANNDYTPSVEVKNVGTQPIDFTLNILITNKGIPVYNDSKTYASFAADSVDTATLSDWHVPAEGGTFNIYAYISSSSDENPQNDTIMISSMASEWLWETIAPMPQPRLAHATVYDYDNNKFYIIGGTADGSTNSNTCFEYDVSSDSWKTLSPMPYALDWIKGTYVDGKIYIVNGYDGTNIINVLSIYDVSSDSWNTGSTPPEGTIAHGLVAYGKYLILFGGIESDLATPNKDVYIYDTESDSWVNGTDMPEGVYMLSAELIGNKIHIVGGNNGTANIDKIMIGTINPVDPTNISWEYGADMPSPNINNGGAVYDGKYYMIGGFLNDVASNEVWEYDPGAKSQWRHVSNAPTILTRNNFASYKKGSKSIYIFGSDTTGSWTASATCYKMTKLAYGINKNKQSITNNGIMSISGNPFNSKVEIKYSIMEKTRVSMQIFSLSGRVVKTLINSNTVKSGIHKVSWNGTDEYGDKVENGVYFYKLLIGKKQFTGRLVLIK